MIRINLLPFRAAREKENIRRQISVFILSLFLVSAILFYVGGYWGRQVERLNSEIVDITQELSVTTAAAKEVDKIKKDLDELQKKTDVIRNLEKTRREPVTLLDTMTGLMVEKRMWLTSFSDKDQTVGIKGIAMDNKTVADFMTRLEGLFSGVTLVNLKQETIRNLSLKSFEITCQKQVDPTAAGSPDKTKAGKP